MLLHALLLPLLQAGKPFQLITQADLQGKTSVVVMHALLSSTMISVNNFGLTGTAAA
jgi:hypothetical protein